MPHSHRLAIQSFSAPGLANYLVEHFHSPELGWQNLFGESWETAYKALCQLPDNAGPWEIRNAVSPALFIQLTTLRCASCNIPALLLINLGSHTNSFFVCEPCLEEAYSTVVEHVNKSL